MDSLTVSSERLIHIDLKGAPLKLCYFEKFFPFIKDLGATGILLEWEDTFPYVKELTPIGGLSNGAEVTGAPYSIEEARQLLNLAAEFQLNVIPLVQIFGHMEYVLKHDQWRNLREVEAYPSSMCPSHSESMVLVRSLLKQIISFHPQIQYIHIGADEVWYMGLCPTCSKRITKTKFGKAGLYLDYITSVGQYLKENYPHLKIIIWDDMLRNIDLHILQEYHISTLFEPMVWHYNSAETFQLGSNLWDKYSNVFTNIWTASAFKGATSSSQILPINKFHISNHEAWLQELGFHGGKILNFKGIALTGWSRYDHYATLCELLPSSIPSLCLCLKTWLNGGYTPELDNLIGKMLGYGEHNTNCLSSVKTVNLPELSFPGWQILVGLEWFVNLKTKYKNIVECDQMQTWFNQWQILNNYTNPMQIDSILPIITELLNELMSLESYLKLHLDPIYYPHTVEELLGTHLEPIKDRLRQLKSDCETQIAQGCRARGQKRLNI